MKHSGVVGQVWYEIAKVVNETEERVKLVRIDREGELLDACDFGGCKRLASDPVTHGHHLPQLRISSRVSICFRFFLQVARVKLHPRSLSQVTCFIFPLFLRAASQFTSAPFLQVARVKLHPHSSSQVTCIILLPLFLFSFSLPFLVLSPSFLSDFSCHKPRCLPELWSRLVSRAKAKYMERLTHKFLYSFILVVFNLSFFRLYSHKYLAFSSCSYQFFILSPLLVADRT